MDYTGKKILETMENSMSITSADCDVHLLYVIILDEGDSVVAELKATNQFMYSGAGDFRRFVKDDIKLNGYLHKRELKD